MASIRKALEKLAEIREKGEREYRAREAYVYARLPELEAVRREMRNAAYEQGQRVLAEPSRADEIIAEYAKKLDELKARESDLLANNPQYAEMLVRRYACNECKDAGYLPSGEKCRCLRRLIISEAFDLSEMAWLDEQNFDTFDLSVFPDDAPQNGGLSQRGLMERISEKCRAYAENFPATEKNNILLLGKTGLGKTFLLSCIAQKVLESGYSVLYFTAFKLLSAMRDFHIGKLDSIDPVFETELLIIDDLGSEPMLNNVSVEYLFALLNERCSRLHTLIATNLSPSEIQSRYGERVASRIFNPSCWHLFRLEGRDVRLCR